MGTTTKPSLLLAVVATFVVALSLLASNSNAERCVPNKNCKPPDCRCWEDRKIPGNLTDVNTPQIVLLTFGNSINAATKPYYTAIMKGLRNPNKCPALATFFIEELNTNFREVKELYEAGFEIGMSTMNDTLPQSPKEWQNNIKRVHQGLIDAGIPESSLRGFRSAQLYAGGDDAIQAFDKLDILYDSTCVNRQYTEMNNMLWPYTYDFPDHTPSCSIGKTPRKCHNGTWQMLMADLKFGQHNCPSPSACSPYIKGQENVFQFLFKNFLNHYNGNKAPFNLYLDPLWLTNEDQNKGTREFLNFIGAFRDVWTLTFQQALDWIKYPVNSDDAIIYPPWGCGKDGSYKHDWHPTHPSRRMNAQKHKDIINMKIGNKK